MRVLAIDTALGACAAAVLDARLGEVLASESLPMLRGHAEILHDGQEHRDAQALLRSRYPQLRAMQIATYPVIAVRIERTTSWGSLAIDATS